MQSLELRRMELIPLTEEENKEITGGFWWELLAAAIISIADNFADVRQGFSDGFNGKAPRHSK